MYHLPRSAIAITIHRFIADREQRGETAKRSYQAPYRAIKTVGGAQWLRIAVERTERYNAKRKPDWRYRERERERERNVNQNL